MAPFWNGEPTGAILQDLSHKSTTALRKSADRFDRVGVGGVIVVTGGGRVVVSKGKAIVYQRTIARLRAGTPPHPPQQQQERGGGGG